VNKIRVLVVDDAVVVRRLVTDALSAAPDIEVAGVAANGKIALSKLSQVNPDVVTLDVEMPEMDGLETLAAIRRTHPRLPVVMFSTLTRRGATAALEALAKGASDYVTKPANVGNVQEAVQRVRDELIPKLRALCGRGGGPPPPARSGFSFRPLARHPASSRRVELLVIAASTGGPVALTEVLAGLSRGFPVPIAIVQHMPPFFTRLLAERLGTKSAVAVGEGSPGAALTPGRALIAPGDFHMAVDADRRVRLHQGAAENSCRPAADVLFRSAAEAFGGGVLGVVLTGMGQDGLRGCEAIKAAGGQVLVQDEASSVVWGMPGFVARAGLADAVLPLQQLGGQITRLVESGRTAAC
jgi:two-component system chemotaxis response regulator CheB